MLGASWSFELDLQASSPFRSESKSLAVGVAVAAENYLNMLNCIVEEGAATFFPALL
jgi:hypothetical protein